MNEVLKRCCHKLKVPKAQSLRCHDLRRGRAKDLQPAGATLREILEAEQWRSPQFFKYLDLDQLHREMAVSAHLAESDDEE